MERDKIERLIVQVSTYEKGTIPYLCARDQLLAEFDRLILKVAELAADLWDANAALDEAQSWLGTISEPMLEWRQGKKDVADAIELTNQGIASYLDSQKPSEKQKER